MADCFPIILSQAKTIRRGLYCTRSETEVDGEGCQWSVGTDDVLPEHLYSATNNGQRTTDAPNESEKFGDKDGKVPLTPPDLFKTRSVDDRAKYIYLLCHFKHSQGKGA